jgi:hypothetical protein
LAAYTEQEQHNLAQEISPKHFYICLCFGEGGAAIASWRKSNLGMTDTEEIQMGLGKVFICSQGQLPLGSFC